MRRRRLMIGLGVVTIGSATTALTGATLSNTVSPTADFRINVEGGLVVRAGSNFPGSTDNPNTGVGDDDAEYILSDSSNDAVFDDLNDKTSLTAVADTQENGDLHIGLAFPYSEITPPDDGTISFDFPNLLEVQNNTSDEITVAVAYQDDGSSSIQSPSDDSKHGFEINPDSGSAAVSETGNGTDKLSFDQVAYMFHWRDESNTMISPPGSNDPGNQGQNVSGGTTVSGDGGVGDLSLVVNVSSDMKGIIDQYVSDQNLTANGGNVPLVDAIWVGEYDI